MDFNLIFQIVTIVVTAAAAISAIFPVPVEGSKWQIVRKVIDFLAINIGNAKNVSK